MQKNRVCFSIASHIEMGVLQFPTSHMTLSPNENWLCFYLLIQCGGSVCDLLAKQWFIAQWIPSVTMEKSWTPIDCHYKNFNTLILSTHTWNIVKNCPSQIFTACRSDLDNSWQYFMYESSELRCWNFCNGSQWVFMIFPLSQMGSIGQ